MALERLRDFTWVAQTPPDSVHRAVSSGLEQELSRADTVELARTPWHSLTVRGSTHQRARVLGQLPPRLVSVFRRVM